MSKPFKTTRFVAHFLQRRLGLALLLAFFVLGAALSGLLPPFALRYLIDGFITPALASGASPDAGALTLIALAYFGSYALIGAFQVGENYLVDSFGQKMIRSLRFAMVEKSQRIRSEFFTSHGTGEMTSRVTDDVYAIELLFADGLVQMIVSLFSILGILVSVFFFSWALGLILAALIPVIFLVTQLFRKGMLKSQVANRKIINKESNDLAETIDGALTIKNLGKEGYREKQFVGLLQEGYAVLDKTAWFDSVYSPILEILKAAAISAVSFLVVYSLAGGGLVLGLTVGTFAAALSLISNVFSPIEDIGQELQDMQEGVSGIQRVVAFMNEPEISPKDGALSAAAILAGKAPDLILFSGVSFHYGDGEELVFNQVSLAIHPLDRISVVGRTGAGKTTMFRLILGLLEPTAGTIAVNGVEASKIPDGDKRAIFGYVEQGFRPVPGSVKDQVTLGEAALGLEAVRAAMRDSFLDEYVMSHLPGGYDAPFDEKDFSRGQLQLLGLARAIVANPKILLLDEISANLDSETEKQVIEALAKASSERTVISISHRLSDCLGFTRVIDVERGEVQEKELSPFCAR
jgi:ATP-binding cassette subfamily B protein